MKSNATRRPLYHLLMVATAMSGFVGVAQAGSEVNVYSYRQPTLVQPLFDGFTKETGIKVNMIFAKKGLIERIYQEDANSPADVLLTVDIGRLTGSVNKGITQAVSSDVLSKNIPAIYRDPDGHWFGLTQRARVIYAARDRVKQDAITYEELADPKWKGKICMRSGQHVYNVALIASMIKHHGEDKAKTWLKGLRDNLARDPKGNDRAQVKGVFSGECDLAIGNTYYMAKMMLNDKQPEQKEWAASVKMLFPNSADRGTHVNLSGVVLAKNAPNRDNAVKLMEYLSSAQGQEIYASVNHEYPLKAGIPWSDLVKSWGEFKTDPLSLEDIATLRKRASEMVDEVRFDQGPSS
ncbi:MAG: Fe(3+) ABC transporter substrate-binding protein [Rhizobiales bacterium]|nr:Fe(3+) ABC transporter substrate-binding protein [Hyphomicrobiales bacterium]